MTLTPKLPVAKVRRRALLVVGMHRSGTSAVTRMMSLLGARLPNNLLAGNFSNEPGHWEPENIVAFHEQMLRSAGSSWDSVFGLERDWFSSDAAARYTDSLAQMIQSEYSDAPLFVVKDPRLALFVPIWQNALDLLDVEPSFVLPFRRPREVELSLKARHLRAWPDVLWADGKGELLWLRQVLAAEGATRGQMRSFVSYDALLTDWKAEAERIAAQLKLDWPDRSQAAESEIDGFLSRKHKHQNSETNDICGGTSLSWMARVTDQLNSCVSDPQTGADTFDAAQEDLDSASQLFGPYIISLQVHAGMIPVLKEELGRAAKQAEQAIAVRDAEITSRDAEILVRDRKLADSQSALAQAESELDRALREAREAIAARDAEIVSRDQMLAEIRSELVRANEEVQSSNKGRETTERELVQAQQDAAANNRMLVETARSLKIRSREAREDRAARRREVNHLTAQLDQLREQLDASDRALGKVSARLKRIESSTAWRATYPARACVALARRLGRQRLNLTRPQRG